MRSTGTGCALAFSHTSRLLGPLVGGIMLALHWASSSLFYLIALPPLLAMISAIIVGVGHSERKGALEEDEPGPHHAVASH
jgi:MFS transporter, AAHS family, 4-hydroxybenzoate transporter